MSRVSVDKAAWFALKEAWNDPSGGLPPRRVNAVLSAVAQVLISATTGETPSPVGHPETITDEGKTWAMLLDWDEEDAEEGLLLRHLNGNTTIIRLRQSMETMGFLRCAMWAGSALYLPREPQVIECEVTTDSDGLPVSLHGVTGEPNTKYRAILVPDGATYDEAAKVLFSSLNNGAGYAKGEA